MRLAVSLLAAALLACGVTPREDYDDYLARTADRRSAGDAGITESTFHDLRGVWLVHATLTAGLELGLRIQLSGPDDPPPVELTAKLWLERQDPEVDPPLVTTTAVVEQDGRFTVEARPLVLGTDVVNTDDPVVANVTLVSRTLGSDNWCGQAEGEVSSPLTLELVGSTFSAHRDDGTLVSAALPSQCTDLPEPPQPDAGVEDGDGGVGPARPASPDLGDVAGERRDISGHWLLRASIVGLPLDLWLSLVYGEGDENATLDGALRRAADPPGSPALTTFDTRVDADGFFEVWLPDFELTTTITIEGDILLRGAILPSAFCGGVAGALTAPPLVLDGSTFLAVPWIPGTDLPAEVGRTCADAP